MNIANQIDYWKTSSQKDWETANDIYLTNKNLHFCLFICHLVVEKLLKALVIKKTISFPPKTHNLLRLAELSELNFTEEDLNFLQTLNQFQLATRYPDDKFIIYKIANLEYTSDIMNKMKKMREWLISTI